jgi:hypothetical protein
MDALEAYDFTPYQRKPQTLQQQQYFQMPTMHINTRRVQLSLL